MRAPPFHERVYRALLLGFPQAFRDEFSEEMQQHFRDRRRESDGKRWGLTGIWGPAIGDVLLQASAARGMQMKSAVGALPRFNLQGALIMLQPFRDIREALRGLIKRPAFGAVVTLTLALGIGANTSVLTVLDSVILAPLPYDEPGRLVRLYQVHPHWAAQGGYVTGPAFLDYRSMLEGLESVAGLYNYRELGFTLTEGGVPRWVIGLPVSSGYFEVYRARPMIGRTFLEEEETPDARVVVVSHRLWLAALGADRDILGRHLALDGDSYEVVGVMPETFYDVIVGDVDLWIPRDLRSRGLNSRGNHNLTVIGRLRPDRSLEAAQAELDALSASQAELYPEEGHEDWTARLVALHEDVVGDTRPVLLVLMGAASLVLLIACVNVANLFLVRNLARQHELAIRSSLGSGRARLIRGLLTESAIVALVGGLAGIFLAHWGVDALLAVIPGSLPRAQEIAPDAAFLLLALAVTLATAVAFSVAPSLRFTGLELGPALGDAGRSGSRGVRSGRIRAGLVTTQVALALVLLIGAGLLMKSFLNLQRADLGLRPGHVMTFEIHLPDSTYAEPSRRIAFHQRFADRVASIPGVEAAGAISWLPVSGPYNNWTFTYISAEGELLEHEGEAGFRVVAGRYFEAMNIPLAMGRRFERSDDGDSPLVAMISQSTARRYYEGRDPLIQDVIVDGRRWRVIGVVEDVAYDHRGTTENTIYLPHSQFGDDRNWALTQVISMSEPRSDLLELVRGDLAEIDADLVVHNPRSMQEVMGRAIARDRFALLLMGLFAAVALTLAFVGIYGVLAYSVDQRAREIGVRMALGATPWTVVREVIRKGMGWTAAGIVIGLVGAFALTRLLGSMLFAVSVTDGATFFLGPVAVALVSCLAGYVPAKRAARVDPLEVLRQE